MVGDLNFHMDNTSSSRFLSSLTAHGLKQHVTTPTHVKGHILDVLLTRDTSDIIRDVAVTDPGLSDKDGMSMCDHFAVLGVVEVCKPSPLTKEVQFRRIRQIDIDSFKKDIQTFDLQNCPIEDMTEMYDQVMSNLIDKHAPLVRKRITMRPETPWFTKNLAMLKREKRNLEKKWRRSRAAIDHQLYRDKCAEFNRQLSKSKADYYVSKIGECGFDSKKMFNIARKLLGTNKTTSLPLYKGAKELSERFSCS